MVQLALGVVGAAVGGFFGGPGGAAAGYTIGSAIGGLLDPPDNSTHTTQEGPRMSDTKIQNASYGVVIPWIRGNYRAAGNLIWAQDIHEVRTETTTTTDSGGKGSPPDSTSTSVTYTYFGRFALGLCEGPRDLAKIWANGKLIYDATQFPAYDKYGVFTFYRGTETQTADPYMESFEGAGNVPAYRGLAYIVAADLPLADFANALPSIEVLITTGYPTWTAVIYTSNGGVPDQLVAQSEPQTIGYTPVLTTVDSDFGGFDWGIYRFAIDATLSAGTYFIGVVGDAGIDTPGNYGIAPYQIPSYRLSGSAHGVNVGGLSPDQTFGGTSIVNVQMKCRAVLAAAASASTLDPDAIGTGIPDYIVLSNGNLTCTAGALQGQLDTIDTSHTGAPHVGVYGMAIANERKFDPAGQYYWEVTVDAGGVGAIGVAVFWWLEEFLNYDDRLNNLGLDSICGQGFNGGSFSPGDVVGVAMQVYTTNFGSSAYTWFSKNGTWLNGTPGDIAGYGFGSVSGSDGPTAQEFGYPFAQPKTGDTYTFNFGATPYAHTPPSGFGDWSQAHEYIGSLHSAPYSDLSVNYGDTAGVGIPDINDVWGSRGHHLQGYHTAVVAYAFPDCDVTEIQLALYTLDSDAILGAGNTTGLPDVVGALIEKTGVLTSSDYDLSALAPFSMRGMAVGRTSNVRQVLQSLQDAFLFDLIESDYQIKAVMRGGAPVAAIVEDDLAAITGDLGDPPPKLDDKRVQDFDLPRRVVVNYQSAALDYQPNSQAAQRMVTTQGSRSIKTLEFAMVFSEYSARQIAQKVLWTSWLYREQLQLTLPPSYIVYDAADVLTVTADGVSRPLYVNSVELSADNLVSMKGVLSDELVVTSIPAAATDSNYTTQTGTPIEDTTLLLFDSPLLRKADDDYGFYLGAHGVSTNWRGAAVYKSADNAAYSPIANIGIPASAGAATTVLATAANYEIFDRTNTVRISLDYGTLASVTELGVLNNSNIALLGDELLGFATATLVSPGVYDLSDLLRGMQGSEWAMATHTNTDRFILLASNGSVQPATITQSERGALRYYKGVTIGQSISTVSPQTFTALCTRIKPLAPVQITGARDGVDNLNIVWVPRARMDIEIIDVADTGIDEAVEAYEVDIMSGLTVLRTLSTAKPSVLYTDTQQTADGLTPGDPVVVNVYQISNRVGRGYAGSATI